MKKNKQRKLEKKRRVERERHREKAESMAYRGNKYKTDALVPVVFQTEAGVYESFVMSDRKITDHDVRKALQWLIGGIRAGTIDAAAGQPDGDDALQEPNLGLITWNIRRHWSEFFAKEESPGRDKLIGVMRTIMGSIETWGNISPTSRGYLRYLEGFMGKLGVHCRAIPPDFEVSDVGDNIDCTELPDEEDEDELLLAGRVWTQASDANAGVVFRALADEMIAAGQAEEVADTCQQLMGETRDCTVVDELGRLSLRAQQRLEPAPSAWRGFMGRLIGR